jgi:hypothetical protein
MKNIYLGFFKFYQSKATGGGFFIFEWTLTNLPLTTRYVLGVFDPSQNVERLHQCENRGRLRDNAV